MNRISPSYLMNLVDKVAKEIWNRYGSYSKTMLYIEKWHIVEEDRFSSWENFAIETKEPGKIDLDRTLHNMDGETLIKVAIDMGVDTPDMIPSIPLFKNEIKAEYPTASQTFKKAFKETEEHPDIAIGLANSALESIIKEILKDERVKTKSKQGETHYKLVINLLTEVGMFPNNDMPIEIRNIASSLLKASQNIEGIRSNSTSFHGKTEDDYLISDPMYTYFVINSITTVGMLLLSLFKKNYPPQEISFSEGELDDDLPF